MAETYEQQRRRILLANPQTEVAYYDLAYLFGYKPESWDGMWKLRAHRPIIQLTRNWAIAAEVAGMGRKRQKIRYRLVRARDI